MRELEVGITVGATAFILLSFPVRWVSDVFSVLPFVGLLFTRCLLEKQHEHALFQHVVWKYLGLFLILLFIPFRHFGKFTSFDDLFQC